MPVRNTTLIKNHIPSSPLKDKESPMKQGIVTILGSDSERNMKPGGSIRRTLSADMSSKIWLLQNGFIFKKNEALTITPPDNSSSSSDSESEYEETPNQDDVWASIQAEKEKAETPKQVWGSILTQKSDNSLLPPPYSHPLVKRTKSQLSEKSLKICTESLGSESGTDSDCLSVISPLEVLMNSGDEEKEERLIDDGEEYKDMHVAKYKKSPVRPFPPPISSICGGDGAAVHMQAHRENGRLVVEAVSVPPKNYFHAERQEGRLVLTLIRKVEEAEVDAETVVDDGACGGYEVEKDEEFVVKKNLSLPSGKKTGLVMNINPTWTNKFNMVDDMIKMEEIQIPQSLPPRPRVARLKLSPAPPATASLNAYEYFWRNKAAAAAISGDYIITNKNSKINGIKGYENQDLVMNKGKKTEHFSPYLRGCKEARRSLLSWVPYCIATS